MIDLEKTFKECGINITDLAARMNVNRQTIYYYIKQGDKNSVSQLQKIADAAEIPLSKIIGVIEANSTCPHCGKPIKIKIEG